MRLTVGTMMIYSHGWPKLLKFFTDEPISFADPIGLGMETSLILTVFAEVFCSFLLIIGLGTRIATIPLIITMLVAIFAIHWDDPFGKKEFALLYLVPYVSIFLMGAGRYSLDNFLFKND
jgi:putative oxidoreductase